MEHHPLGDSPPSPRSLRTPRLLCIAKARRLRSPLHPLPRHHHKGVALTFYTMPVEAVVPGKAWWRSIGGGGPRFKLGRE